MKIINASDNFQKATWLDTDFPTLIVDNFIDNQEGEKLTRDGKIFIKSEAKNNTVVHGGRILIPFSSDKFKRLLEGIHPTFKQVPPSVPLLSTQAVFRPS